MKRYIVICILLTLLGFVVWQGQVVSKRLSGHAQTQAPQKLGAPIIRCPDAPKITKSGPDETATFKNGTVNFKGVQFSWNPKLALAVFATARSANPLRCPADVPVYNTAPAHNYFSFVGTHKPWQEDGSYRIPELRVYPVVAYRQIFAASNSEPIRRFVDDGLSNLEQTLTNKPLAFGRDAPFLFFMGESQQMYQAKVHYLNFKNGQGVAYITTYRNDQSRLITNKDLLWVFQGLTNNRQYLVLAVFPVSIPASAQTPKTIKMATAATISQRLDKLSDEIYSPDLKLFDEVIQSLAVIL